MELTRRQLIVLAGAATLGCTQESGRFPAFPRGPVNAGSITDYSHDGIYDRFRDSHGFFLVRTGRILFAQSAICTHRACKLRVADRGLLCPCHGSEFAVDGRVRRGPASRDLPRFSITKDAQGLLIVRTDLPLRPEQFDLPEAMVVME